MKKNLFEFIFNIEKKESYFKKIAVHFNNKKYSYSYIHNRSLNISENILKLNFDISKNNPLIIIGDNSLDMICLILALCKINYSFIILSQDLPYKKLQIYMSLYKPSLIIFDNKSSELYEKITKKRALLSTDLIKPNSNGQNPNLLINKRKKSKLNESFIITLSSGSTSLPKPILMSQDCKIKRALFCKKSFNITEKDKISCTSPFHHSLGLRLLFVSLTSHATLILYKNFNLINWLRDVKKDKVTVSILISNHLNLIYKSQKINLCKKLNVLVSSSSDILFEIKEIYFNTLKNKFFEMYGTSETSTNTILNYDSFKKYPKSVGTVCKNTTIKILNNKNDKSKPGEILVKSNLIFNGYLKKNKMLGFSDKYFKTGDIGYVKNNNLFFLSRKKRMIILSGMNIFPKDIEDELNKYKKIKGSLVLPKKNNLYGEIIVAHCLLKNKNINIKKLRNDIYTHLQSVLTKFQIPSYIHFHYQFKYLSSGKIDIQYYLKNY